ncbi:MAG: MaoC family dehydratase, partial [Alphaproteobacteria bacterium]|nr:MaoC family dehydratase [Alphaproteobacteria bacterium]
MVPHRGFDELRVGEKFVAPSRTVTDANFSAFQAVSLDNHPIHYDAEYCRRLGYPAPLAHGLQVLSFTAAGAGLFPHVVGENLVGFIEVSAKFLKPVYPGDTLYPALEIVT